VKLVKTTLESTDTKETKPLKSVSQLEFNVPFQHKYGY